MASQTSHSTQDKISTTNALVVKDADSSDKQETRPYLIQYLKGTIKEKQDLEQQHKELYDYFEKIWGLRKRHLVEGLPSQATLLM